MDKVLQAAGAHAVAPRPTERRRRSALLGRGWERPPISACLDRHRAGWRCTSPSSPPLRGRSQPAIPSGKAKRTKRAPIHQLSRIEDPGFGGGGLPPLPPKRRGVPGQDHLTDCTHGHAGHRQPSRASTPFPRARIEFPVQKPETGGIPTLRESISCATGDSPGHRGLPGGLQPEPQALHLDEVRRRHPEITQT